MTRTLRCDRCAHSRARFARTGIVCVPAVISCRGRSILKRDTRLAATSTAFQYARGPCVTAHRSFDAGSVTPPTIHCP
jgi:hypothetical protein